MSGTRASNDRSSHPGGGGVKRARSEPGGNKVTVVLGAQWGDEGKGKVVDLLATESDIVCRCQENEERKAQAAKSEKRKKQLKGEDAKRLKGEYGKSITFNKN